MAKKKTKDVIDVNLVNHKASSWCIENGYKIYPTPQDSCKGRSECNEYKIVIERAGKKRIGEKTYTYIQCQNKMWELYSKLYGKEANRT